MYWCLLQVAFIINEGGSRKKSNVIFSTFSPKSVGQGIVGAQKKTGNVWNLLAYTSILWKIREGNPTAARTMQEALTCGLPFETLSNTFLFKGARQVNYTDCLLLRQHCRIQLQYFFTTIRQHLKIHSTNQIGDLNQNNNPSTAMENSLNLERKVLGSSSLTNVALGSSLNILESSFLIF